MLVHAHAKVNLALSVGPPNDTGMHPLCGLFCAIDLCEDITLDVPKPGDDDPIWSCRFAGDAPRPSHIDWPAEKDLTVRALRLLEQHTGRELPTRISVIKRIPVGGGLGGGSADAAAVLRALQTLHHITLDPIDEHAIATRLGSDVPFFLDQTTPLDRPTSCRPAIVSGLGEQVERLTEPPTLSGELLLAFPDAACNTAQVYRAFDNAPTTLDERRLRQAADQARTGDFSGLWNDLAAPARRVAPEVARIQQRLAEALTRPAHITGSGSTVFAVLESNDDEKKARSALTGVPVRRVKLLG